MSIRIIESYIKYNTPNKEEYIITDREEAALLIKRLREAGRHFRIVIENPEDWES